MFKKLAPREIFLLACIMLGTWFCGAWVGGNNVAGTLSVAYAERLEFASVAQSSASADEFLELANLFGIAVHDIVNMKCPDIAAQLKKIPQLEHLQ